MRCFLLVFLCCLTATAGQAQFGHLIHKTYAQRYLAIDTVYFNQKIPHTDSTAFFAELNQLAAAAKKSGDEELLLETKFLKAEYYMVGKQRNQRLFLAEMQALKDAADSEKILQLQIRARHKLGYFYFHKLQKYGHGFENYLEAYELMREVPDLVLPSKQEMVAEIGNAYYFFAELELARKFLNKALSIAPSYKKRLPINITNTMGLMAFTHGEYDSAHFYYQKALNLAEAAHDSAWIGIVSGNMGYVHFIQKEYDRAIPLLEINVAQSIKIQEMDQAAYALINLARIFLIKENHEKASQLTDQAYRLVPLAAEKFFLLKEIYGLKASLNKHTGNFRKAYLFADSSRIMADSIYNQRRTELMQRAENKVKLQIYNNQQLKNEHKAYQRNYTIIATISTVILISLIIIIAINRQRVILKLRQQQLQTEKKTIESELEEARLQLESFTNSIKEKNQLIEQYAAEIKREQTQAGEPYFEAQKETLQQLLNATLLTDQQWKEFTYLFEKVHGGFLQRLKEKLPNLSPADVRYVVLTKLDLAPKEMAAMLGVRPDAIRVYKHRLRKKLDLVETEPLEEVLNAI